MAKGVGLGQQDDACSLLLSQIPLREQIENEGITDALGATTWHSQLGGAMNTYAHPFRCYLNEVDPPHAGYELWDIDNQRAHREIWDNDEPWVEPQSMTYPYAIPAWVQEAIIRVNLLRLGDTSRVPRRSPDVQPC